MDITDDERKLIKQVQEENRHVRWARWLGLGLGSVLCAIFWRTPVAAAQWIYSGRTEFKSAFDPYVVATFLLGLYFVVTALMDWHGNWRNRLILKLAKECGVLEDIGSEDPKALDEMTHGRGQSQR